MNPKTTTIGGGGGLPSVQQFREHAEAHKIPNEGGGAWLFVVGGYAPEIIPVRVEGDTAMYFLPWLDEWRPLKDESWAAGDWQPLSAQGHPLPAAAATDVQELVDELDRLAALSTDPLPWSGWQHVSTGPDDAVCQIEDADRSPISGDGADLAVALVNAWPRLRAALVKGQE